MMGSVLCMYLNLSYLDSMWLACDMLFSMFDLCCLQTLHECQMMRYDAKSGSLHMTELGRIASHFYISHASINTINENLKSAMTIQEVFLLIAECAEFESLKVRDEEMPDLEKLRERACKFPLTKKDEGKVALGNREGKVQVLIQVCVRAPLNDVKAPWFHACLAGGLLDFKSMPCQLLML